MNYADEKTLGQIDAKAEELKNRILNAKSEYPRTAQKIYVSNNGDDNNNGETPETAIATLGKLNAMDIKPGQVVLFERGGVWRGLLWARTCVTYSAYGEGEKPKLLGKGGTAEGKESWEKTDVPNVWVMTREIPDDVGNILFDGKYYSRKRFSAIEKELPDGRKEWTRPDGVGPYNGLSDLKENLQFHHDKTDNKVYLYCDKGNPGEVYKTAEVVCKGHCIQLASGCTIDNICAMYSGSHAMGGGYAVKVTVRNCEIAWCGGSFLSDTTLYGNAVELYGSCDGFYVTDNYIHDIYDTGITHQYWSTTVPAYMHDCRYERNLIEYCYWNIEYVARGDYADDNRMSEIYIRDNILRHAGEGWGNVRAGGGKTGAHIKGWPIESPADNMYFSGNIFDRSSSYLIDCGMSDEKYMPVMEGNTYIQYDGAPWGYCGVNDPQGRRRDGGDQYGGSCLFFDENLEKDLAEKVKEKDAVVYAIKK